MSSEKSQILSPNQGAVSMRQVATKAGVSVATVSNLLSGRSGAFRISDEVRARVLQVCRQEGYEPNIHARRMFRGKSQVLGLVFPSLEDHLRGKHEPDLLMAGFIQGATAAATRGGYQVVLTPATREFLKDKKYLRQYRGKAVDAFLIWGAIFDSPFVDELHQHKVPFVLLQSHPSNAEARGYDFVGSNDFDATVACVEHLLELGHRSIGYIQGYLTSSVGVDRWTGFRSAMQSRGLYNDKLVVEGDYSYECGMAGAERIIGRNPDVTAIICASELCALGAIKYLTGQGKKVPQDVSIVGSDGSRMHFGTSLTRFITPAYDIGERATEAIVRRLEQKDSSEGRIWERLEADVLFGETTTKARI